MREEVMNGKSGDEGDGELAWVRVANLVTLAIQNIVSSKMVASVRSFKNNSCFIAWCSYQILSF